MRVDRTDPALAPASSPAATDAGRVPKLAQEEAELLKEIAAVGTEQSVVVPPERFLRELTIDPTSLRGPEPETSIRPDGQLLRAKAWSPGRDQALAPDLALELTEYPDPGGEATYFRVPDGAACVEDELIHDS